MLDLVEIVIQWPSLPSPIVHATLALARSQSLRRRALDRPKTCASVRHTEASSTRLGASVDVTDAREVRCAEAFGTVADCCCALCPTEQRHCLESAAYDRFGGKS